MQTLTHDSGQGAHPSIVRLSTNVFAVAYHGTSGKGIIKTFTIASDGSAITENQDFNTMEVKQSIIASFKLILIPTF